MKKKVLIISVSVGAGHVRAAQALDETVSQSFAHAMDATHIDMMAYLALPVKTAVKSYDLVVRQMPELWGFLYKKSDSPDMRKHYLSLTNVINRMNATKLYEYVHETKPDVILCTHFLPAQTLFAAPTKYRFTQPICLVMTDYDKHTLLTMKGFSRYFVATEKMRQKMLYEGHAPESVIASGIPVSPVFYAHHDRTALRAIHHIANDKKMILVLSGGFGLSHTEKIIPALFALSEPATIVAVAGKNEVLETSLCALHPPAHIDMRVIGWTDRVHEYMSMADVIVSKPGGLTTSECIALGVPIIAVQPIPGQEEHNAEFLLEHGYGVVAHGSADLQYYVSNLDALPQQKKQPQRIAAEIILNEVRQLLS